MNERTNEQTITDNAISRVASKLINQQNYNESIYHLTQEDHHLLFLCLHSFQLVLPAVS